MMRTFKEIDSLEVLDEIDALSESGTGVLIYKHSTRCFISSMAERNISKWDTERMPAYYLDLIRYRSISNEIASRYNVQHESPQLLWIIDRKCKENASHESVGVETVESWLAHA